MILTVKQTGAAGLAADSSPENLPTNAWTSVSNIRFADDTAQLSPGYSQVYNPPSVAPLHVFPVSIGTARYWIYAGASKVYCVNGSTHTDLSPAGAYTGVANKWTSCVLGGFPVINPGNTTDYPQSWDLNLANNFGNLTNWPASTYCKAIRSYKNYLVALGITKGSTAYPVMVKWSHPASSGALPSSWDQTDQTKDAGEFDLAEGEDLIVDGMQLRDAFMIYKERSVWRMDYVGGSYVMGFRKVLGQSGALNRNCIVEVDGVHFVLTGDDFIIHDGNAPTSVLDRKARRALFSSIDSDNYANAFVFKNPYMAEVFVCYPSYGATYCDMALVYNYSTKTVSFRSLPNIGHAQAGLTETGLSATWDSDANPWDSDATLWNQVDFTPGAAMVMLAGSADTKLYLLDAEHSANGSYISGYAERVGLHMDQPSKIKLVKAIRPRIYGTNGETVTISVGYADTPYDAPTYTDATYTIGTTKQCDFTVSGRYIAVKFASASTYQWRLDSYDIDYEIQGDW